MVAVLVVGFGLGVATLASPGPQRRLAETLTCRPSWAARRPRR